MTLKRSCAGVWAQASAPGALLMAAGVFAGMLLGPASPPARAADLPAEVYGTIVSVRGNILVLRPSLRPKLTRIAIDEHTQILGFERADASVLKPGMRIACGGRYTDAGGFHPQFIEAAEIPFGELAQRSDGLHIDKEHNRAFGTGTLKSVKPFVFTDDAGHEITGTLDKLFGVWHDLPVDRKGLLIGTRIDAQGRRAPDGVIQATSIAMDNSFTRAGTMFGVITAVQGNTLQVRPKYSTDTIRVTYPQNVTLLLQKQISLAAERIHVGDTITFWGQFNQGPTAAHSVTQLNALALIVGKQRYPAAAGGSEGGVFLTGKITSLDPTLFRLPGGKTIQVVVPAQMPIVRLETAPLSDLKPGTEAMLVLSRAPDGGFQTSTIVLDASPWVGYGG